MNWGSITIYYPSKASIANLSSMFSKNHRSRNSDFENINSTNFETLDAT